MTTGRMIPPGNIDYWTDDTSGETLTTGRIIPPGNGIILPVDCVSTEVSSYQ
jgi:hypothetical protein